MLALGSLKNQWHWMGLALLCALIAITAFVAPGRIGQLELRREAIIAADRIRAQMLKEPDTVFEALSRPGHAPQLANVIEHSGYAHRVLRFELYDNSDRLEFTSGLSGLNLSSAAALAEPTPDTPEVALYENAAGGDAPTHFAVLTLPLQLNGTAERNARPLSQPDRPGERAVRLFRHHRRRYDAAARRRHRHARRLRLDAEPRAPRGRGAGALSREVTTP